MIEPQNTMLPLAAEPRPGDTSAGDEGGFGEMLAQSLGMVTQVDPAVVQQVVVQQVVDQYQQGSANGESDGSTAAQDAIGAIAADDADASPQRIAWARMSPNVGAPSLVAEPLAGVGDIGVPTKIGATVDSPIAVGSTPIVKGEVRTLPTEPKLTADPDLTRPVRGIGEPVLVEQPGNGVGANPDQVIPVDSIGVPVLTTDPDADAGPVAPPPGDAPPRDATLPRTPAPGNAVAPVRGVLDPDAAVAVKQHRNRPSQPAPLKPPKGGELPAPPTLLESGPSLDAVAGPGATQLPPTGTSPATAPSVPHGSPAVTSGDTPATRIDMRTDVPVMLDEPRQGASKPPTRVAVEPSGAVNSEAIPGATTPVGNGPVSSLTQAASGPAQASALAERVMHAIDLQRTQPPPRSMVVDIPEVEGLRIVVSVGSGGRVHVATAGNSNPEALSPFMGDLTRVLADRGFVMTGDGQRRGNHPHPADEPAPFRPRRPVVQRSIRTDNDLRI